MYGGWEIRLVASLFQADLDGMMTLGDVSLHMLHRLTCHCICLCVGDVGAGAIHVARAEPGTLGHPGPHRTTGTGAHTLIFINVIGGTVKGSG
jgi:hypothetical protein